MRIPTRLVPCDNDPKTSLGCEVVVNNGLPRVDAANMPLHLPGMVAGIMVDTGQIFKSEHVRGDPVGVH